MLIVRPVPQFCMTKELASNVTEQLWERVNWLGDIILKGQPGMSKTEFKDKEEVGDTWLILVAVTLEPSAKVMKQGILEGERDENKELLPTMWSKAPESIIHELWLLPDWEMQTMELWPLIVDDVRDFLAAFS